MAYYSKHNDGLNAVQRYHAKCDAITIRPKKAEGERIRSAATALGYDSLSRFIMDAINHFLDAQKGKEAE